MSQYQQVKTHRQRALILLPLLSLSLFFLSWELIVDMGLVPQTLLASPSAVVELFFAKLANASPDGMLLQEHAWISIKEAFLGYFLALAVGIPLGLAMGWFRLAEGLAQPHFRIHPAHPAHRVDSADHLLVRHRPDGQGVHHLDRRHRALRHQFLCGRAHDQSGLSPDGQALRRDELAAFLDRMHPLGPAYGLRRAPRSRWRGAG